MKDGRTPDRAALALMADSLRHRGPDSDGEYLLGSVGLACKRLAIIDVEHGNQPLMGPLEVALIGNGEIYNHIELRGQLSERFNPRTDSDFDPLLYLLAADDVAEISQLRGMYSFAVHRPRFGDVILARDPFGIKPLYTLETPDMLAFASEPRAMFAAGLTSPVIDPGKRLELLQLQYTTGRDTIFEGIRRVLPGEALRIVDGKVTERVFLDPIPNAEMAPSYDFDDAISEFDAVFEESVDLHRCADVPYGMFLSGGIDSAALLTMIARLDSAPVKTFTCGFSGANFHDERPAARRIAEALGANHTEVEFGEEDFWTLLPAVAAAFDEPTTDYAILPTYKLGEVARRTVKVVLSGEGGDELLAGYGRYRSLFKPWWWGGGRLRTKGILEGLGVLRDECRGWAAGIDSIRKTASRPDWSDLQSAQATDIRAWLHGDLLLKLDRALMAHGVEGRTPFLDRSIANFAFNLPDHFKVKNCRGKWLLRNWLAKHCPAASAFERKRGFTVPVGDWIARQGRELGALVAARPPIEALCDREQVISLFRSAGGRRGRAAWTLLFFALWHRHHIEGGARANDVRQALLA